MKILITANEVRAFAKTNEKRMSLAPGTIITPAAWDEARECGISIETNAPPQETPTDKAAMESGCVTPEFLARIVGEVIACLQQTKQITTEPLDTDPSGLKRIRSDRMVFSGAATGDSCDNVKTCELFGPRDGAGFSTRILTLADTSFSRELKFDETWHVLEGTLEFTVNGNRFAGAPGDTFFLPAHRMITLSTSEKAKIFAVTATVR